MKNDKIFALSSGFGKSGVAVIRVSGQDMYADFLQIINKDKAIPRHAYFTNFMDDDNKLIDQCIAIYFKAPHSFTGQDLIEIHTHGAVSVIDKVFDTLINRGAVIAEPGEFSKRAFYNNKMNLTEVDGLASLLDARTDKQRINALRSMTGSDTKVYEAWRSDMIEIAAYSAAILDYPEEELPGNISDKLLTRTKKLVSQIENAVSGYGKSKAIKHGFNIVLTGVTNVGKSSIFNRLVGDSRAIVSDIHGTTRDVISTDIDIDGYLVHLLDTAGIRDSQDAIEKIGIKKTNQELKNADLILRIYTDQEISTHDIKSDEIIVFNKSDLIKNKPKNTDNIVYVSALTGDGMEDFLNLIKTKIKTMLDSGESDISVNKRTMILLTDTLDQLRQAVLSGTNHDIFAQHVRIASNNIGKILGTIHVSEITDATFNQLCLGK